MWSESFLEQQGIDVIDSDLGERIVQLAGETPSHIVMPCIHWKKEEIGKLFTHTWVPKKAVLIRRLLTAAAREHLRDTFLTRKPRLPASISPLPKRASSWCVPTKAMPTWARTWLTCILLQWVLKKSSRSETPLCFFAPAGAERYGAAHHTRIRRTSKNTTEQGMHIVLVDNGRSRMLASRSFAKP
jgi:L-lactate dehydrogenase complex protein LldF